MQKGSKTFLFAITMVFGLLCTSFGAYLSFWADNQMRSYNLGITHYRQMQLPLALRAFEVSQIEYEIALKRSWVERFLFPKPNREVAALAAMQRGKILIRLKKMDAAKKALIESTRLNPGSGYREIPGFMDRELSAKDVTRLMTQAKTAKYNLELLIKNTPPPPMQDETKEGKKSEAEEKEEEKEQIPQLAPGSKPGKGGPDDI